MPTSQFRFTYSDRKAGGNKEVKLFSQWPSTLFALLPSTWFMRLVALSNRLLSSASECNCEEFPSTWMDFKCSRLLVRAGLFRWFVGTWNVKLSIILRDLKSNVPCLMSEHFNVRVVKTSTFPDSNVHPCQLLGGKFVPSKLSYLLSFSFPRFAIVVCLMLSNVCKKCPGRSP